MIDQEKESLKARITELEANRPKVAPGQGGPLVVRGVRTTGNPWVRDDAKRPSNLSHEEAALRWKLAFGKNGPLDLDF